VDPLNPPPPAFNSYPEDVIEVEDTVEPEDKTVPASVHEIGNEVRSSVEEGAATMENLVRILGNVKEGAECKKLKKEVEEARFSNTLLQNVNATIVAEWARQANAKNNASGSGKSKSQVTTHVV
nr:hypothetical protein [Tanacetum cinerariifolium]